MDWMEHAQSFVVDIDRREFVDDLKTRSAVERAVEIIGKLRNIYLMTYAGSFPTFHGKVWPECETE